jgi:hypothetical protein
MMEKTQVEPQLAGFRGLSPGFLRLSYLKTKEG